MDTTITTLEMCAGYGGIGLGIKNIFGERLRTISYCELEGFAQANLISKMEAGLLDAAPIWSDLKAFPYESFHGLVDILIAGYPCQPFSSAGKRAGKEDPRHLWPWIADGIRLLQPTMCFFENVEGHISLGLSTVISDLEELGYKVSWGVFSASECLDASGRTAPHQRKRVFIMAHRSGERLQGGKWCWKTRAQGESSGHFAECGSSMADSIMRGMSQSRNELGDSCEAGQGRTHFEANSHIAWPSRPGQQQYAWEPPRVVGTVPAKLANFCSRDSQSGGDTAQASGESVGSWGQSEDAMFDCGSSIRGGDQGDESTTRVVGNAASKRSCGGSEDGANQQSEMLGKGYEAVGDSECIRIPTSREHGAMDEASGIPADREGRESAQADPESSATREREGDGCNAAERSKIKCEMGRDAYEPPIGMDLSELSGISHQELAEICDWMVKTESRTDELRLLGNGVVPATATRAFLTLIEELNK